MIKNFIYSKNLREKKADKKWYVNILWTDNYGKQISNLSRIGELYEYRLTFEFSWMTIIYD